MTLACRQLQLTGEAVADQEGVVGSSLIGSSMSKASASIETLARPAASNSIESFGGQADDMHAQVAADSFTEMLVKWCSLSILYARM